MSFLRRLFGASRAEVPRAEPSRPSSPAACPYCGTVIDPAPARSRKCPACRESIVVRTRRSDGAKLLLTEAEGKQFDRQRELDAARNDGIRRSQNIGASINDFERTEKELTEKWGFAPPRDVFWALGGKAALAAMNKRAWHELSRIYWGQARLLYEEGKSHIQLAREASKASLQSYAEGGFVRNVQVMAGCCQLCNRDEGRKFAIAEALEKLPIPHEACENEGWCTCTWSAAIE